MTDEAGYNGWSNYETWVTALWIDNDEGTYEESREIVRQEVGYSIDNQEAGDTFTLAENTRANVARALERWMQDGYEAVVDEMNNGHASVFGDLLGAAWSEVDWYEIAENYLSELADA